MSNQPSGMVTFLFTDIEGSTRLWERQPLAMKTALARHDTLLHHSVTAQQGHVFKTMGDAFCVAFESPQAALAAAVSAQRAIAEEPWGDTRIRVRMALHCGEADQRDQDYFGQTLNRVARLLSAGHGGQVLVSATAWALLESHNLPGITFRDMGERQLKDLVHPERIYQALIPGLPTDFPPLKTLTAVRSNLPAQLTSFIGRRTESAELRLTLETQRLVTLTGVGGTGKTRLALHIAANLLDQFPDGVWLVELAPLADPDLIAPTILSTLGAQEQPGLPPFTSLQNYLRDKEILIVLDNCEHMVGACAQTASGLLAAAPRLKILTSSREALGVRGEVAFPVASLSLPDPKHLLGDERLPDYEAVRLFIDRARLATPRFSVDPTQLIEIARICCRLDGIPLAIELAAARVKTLSVEQIARRLDDRFRLLTGGVRTALPRQQTLRALIDWSYDILSSAEQCLLQRLSVFAGGWTLEAAEVIGSAKGVERGDILDLLAQLVNKSLVSVTDPFQNRATRYHMLETLRQYAQEKLAESGQGEQVRNAHLNHFAQFAEQAEPELVQARQATWLLQLEAEMDNFRAAVEWAQLQAPEQGLQLASAIWRFGLRQGYATEVASWLERFLALAPTGTPACARGLTASSILAMWRNEIQLAQTLAEDSLVLSRAQHWPALEAWALYALGTAQAAQSDLAWEATFLKSLAVYRSLSDSANTSEVLVILGLFLANIEPERSQAYLEEALELARQRGDAITMAGALDNLGHLALGLGSLNTARDYLEESLAIQRPLGASGYMSTLEYLSDLELHCGQVAQALAYCEEGLAMSEQAGLHLNVLWCRARLGYIELQLGRFAQARTRLFETLQEFRATARWSGVFYTLDGLARLATQQHQLPQAWRIYVWTNAARERQGDCQRTWLEQTEADHDLAIIQMALPAAVCATIEAECRRQTIDELIQWILAADLASGSEAGSLP